MKPSFWSGQFETGNRDFLLYAVVASALVLALAKWGRAAGPAPKLQCPEISLGETLEDCPWGGVARFLVSEAEAGRGRQVGKHLEKLLPELDHSLKADAHRSSWKSLWGRSINFDELAGNIIVHPAIIEALGEKFGARPPMAMTYFKAEKASQSPAAEQLGRPIVTDPAGHQLVHAGMEHTYGYLFSVLKTSFGYKRARWVRGEIEEGFGLKAGLLGPKPAAGTLFANVTYFAGHIAFRGAEAPLSILRKGGNDVPSEIRDFDFSKLAPIRLEETVEAKETTGASRKVILRTDLVPFLHPQKDTHLLVYSVVDPASGGDLLITAFPVAQSFVDTVTNADALGENKPVQTRYNAFVDGVTGVKLTGTRKVFR